MAVLMILLFLKFIAGNHSIKTVSHVSVKSGTPVTIPCLYDSKYREHVKYLCAGATWELCSYEIATNTFQNSQKYSISDYKSQTIFTVTIKKPADINSNYWYWCGVEIQNEPDDGQYFYLSSTTGTPSLYVDNQRVTGFIGESITINCYYNSRTRGMEWCKLNSNCVKTGSGLIDGTRVNLNYRDDNRFTVTLSGLSPESSGWYYCVKRDFQMPVHLTVTEKPTEKYNINEVSNVSVKAGASLSIPCLYDSKYKNNVKYFCEGKTWSSCSSATKKDKPQNVQHSVSDEDNEPIFTVTITEVTYKNTHYWCAVEMNTTSNIGQLFHLLVSNSPRKLYVDNQMISGVIDENITINCHYTTSGQMKWCKMGRKCVTTGSGLIDGTRVNLNTSGYNVFSVTLSGLSPESSGWYYCVKGNFQMPVHLTVTEKPTVVATAATVTETGAVTIQRKTTIYVENEQNRLSANLNGLITSLILLIIIGTGVLFIWFIKRRKQAREDSTTTKSSEEEVEYANVHFKKTKAAQGPSTDTDGGVIYSCVVPAKQRSVKRSEDKVLDVTYSTLTCHMENI